MSNNHRNSFRSGGVVTYDTAAGTRIHDDRVTDGRHSFIIKIGGHGTFLTFDDLLGTNPRELDSPPGNLIVIKSELPHRFTNVKPPACSFVLHCG